MLERNLIIKYILNTINAPDYIKYPRVDRIFYSTRFSISSPACNNRHYITESRFDLIDDARKSARRTPRLCQHSLSPK